MNEHMSDFETRIIVIGPDSHLTPEIIAKEVISLPIIVKVTCWGLILSGDPKLITKAVRTIRKLDPARIFSKPRGYPPGDPRICRFHRGGGARPGFHLLEFESTLLPYVSKALQSPESPITSHPKKTPLPLKKLKTIIAESENE
ncbi:MAG: DUF2102 domain-containing protein [Candidatus Helarchaeota archaeon]